MHRDRARRRTAACGTAEKRYRVTRTTGEVQFVTREEMEALHRAHRRRIARAEQLAWLIVRGPQLLGVLILFLSQCVFAVDEAPAPYPGPRTAQPSVSARETASRPGTAAPARRPAERAEAAAPAGDRDTAASARTDLAAQQVRRAFERWLDAWRLRDLAAYLDSYGPAYADAGLTPRAWARSRRERLRAVTQIEIEAEDVVVDFQGGDRARVTFLQHYRDALHTDTVRKELLFERIGPGWRIVAERSRPPAS